MCIIYLYTILSLRHSSFQITFSLSFSLFFQFFYLSASLLLLIVDWPCLWVTECDLDGQGIRVMHILHDLYRSPRRQEDKAPNLHVRQPGFLSCVCSLLAACCWASPAASQSLSFLILCAGWCQQWLVVFVPIGAVVSMKYEKAMKALYELQSVTVTLSCSLGPLWWRFIFHERQQSK